MRLVEETPLYGNIDSSHVIQTCYKVQIKVHICSIDRGSIDDDKSQVQNLKVIILFYSINDVEFFRKHEYWEQIA